MDTVKLVIIGDSGVGKSSLTIKYATNEKFNPNSTSTIGIDFKLKQVMYNDIKYKIQIWDTAGQERYKTITNNYYRMSEGIIFTYSITSKKSFQNVKNWLSECSMRVNMNNIPRILVGTKCDDTSHRVVSYEDGESLARGCGMTFFETSAKTGQDVDKAFTELIHMVIDKRNQPKEPNKIDPKKPPTIKEKQKEKPNKSWCVIL